MKKSSLRFLLTAMSALLLAGSASAAVVGVDDPNDTIIAVYGGGNSNTGWVSAEGGGAQVALRAHERYTTNSGLTAAPNYSFLIGTQVSLDFSFAAIGNTADTDNLGDFQFVLYYDTNPTSIVDYGPGIVVTMNQPNGFGLDNSYGTAATANGDGQEGPTYLTATTTVGQNSQLPMWFGGPTFLTPGEYAFAFEAVRLSDQPPATVARIEANINAVAPVPEPSGALLTGLSALGLMTRRKRTSK